MAITTDLVSLTFLAPRNEFPCLKKPTRVLISSNFGPLPKSRLTMSYSEYNKLYPPKVETYVHPDHLSSAEKTKVSDELKKSESDCGSSGVQVAQLTTQIKHLASCLHKKDKQSRRGLVGMVQKRNKLLTN